jgi:hypothetical protein
MEVKKLRDYIIHFEFLGYAMTNLEDVKAGKAKQLSFRSPTGDYRTIEETFPEGSGYITVKTPIGYNNEQFEVFKENREFFLRHINTFNQRIPPTEKVTLYEGEEFIIIEHMGSYCKPYERIEFGAFLNLFEQRTSAINNSILNSFDLLSKKDESLPE